MKRLLAILLLLASLLAATSCGEGNVSTYQRRGTRSSSMIDTETRILFFHNAQLYYYDKVSGGSRIFCFDPLCEHIGYGDSCLSTRFATTHHLQWLVYSQADGRFYAPRGEKLISFGLDGSEVREDWSFGESGALSEELTIPGRTLSGDFSYGNYIYLSVADAETGARQIVRYHVKKKTLEKLTTPEDGSFSIYAIARGQFYAICHTGSTAQAVRADPDWKHVEFLGDYDFLNSCVCDGEFIYYPKYHAVVNEETGEVVTNGKTGETVMADDGIWKYDPADNSKTRITEPNGTGPCHLLYVTDGYLYYAPYEETEVGTGMVTYSTIWRAAKDGSDPKPVFAVGACDVTGLCVSHDVAILTAQEKTASGTTSQTAYRMTVEPDGTFSDVRALDLE